MVPAVNKLQEVSLRQNEVKCQLTKTKSSSMQEGHQFRYLHADDQTYVRRYEVTGTDRSL